MRKGNTSRFILGLLCLLSLAGCGSGGDSNTNGDLALVVTTADLTGGQYSVVATATYSNGTASSLVGVPIKLVTSIHTLNGTPTVFTDKLSAGSTGIVTASRNILQTTEVIFVDVTASTGGLSQSQTVAVPAL